MQAVYWCRNEAWSVCACFLCRPVTYFKSEAKLEKKAVVKILFVLV